MKRTPWQYGLSIVILSAALVTAGTAGCSFDCMEPCSVNQTRAFQQLVGGAQGIATLEKCLFYKRRRSCELCMPIIKNAYDGNPGCKLERFGEILEYSAIKAYDDCRSEMKRIKTVDFMKSCENETEEVQDKLGANYLSTVMCSSKCLRDEKCTELLERAIKIVPSCAKNKMIRNNHECEKANVIVPPPLQPRPSPTIRGASSANRHLQSMALTMLISVLVLSCLFTKD